MWSSNSDMLTSIHIVNNDLILSLMNIGFSIFSINYKSTYSVAKDLKILDILSISSLCFFENNYIFGVFCKKFIL